MPHSPRPAALRAAIPLLFALCVSATVMGSPPPASAGSGQTPAASVSASPVLEAMQAELARSMSLLGGQAQPPYFLSYEITDIEEAEIGASFGAIVSRSRDRQRLLRVDLRVGDYAMDNTHQVRDDIYGALFDRLNLVRVPIEDDPDALRAVLWFETDRAFKKAQEQYTKVKAQVQVKVAEEDQSADFSREKAETAIEAIPALQTDLAGWEERLRKVTALFAEPGNLYSGDARVTARREVRWFVSSEGTRLQSAWIGYRLRLNATTKADDGMELPRFETWFSYTPEGLPADDVVLASGRRIVSDLAALRVAPVVDPCAAPAILTGRAAAVFFHEVFGHRVEGHRQRNEEEGQTFKKMVGQSVLPAGFTVISDPTLRRAAGVDLGGAYDFDNEGVRARAVTIVDHGVLREFLMSRKPIAGFPASNGHGRGQPGFVPVSRQSVLLVRADQPVSGAELKRMLIERVKKAGKPYGLLFEDIQGGFTITGRLIPNAFNVMPVLVRRVFPDGREELVRGVDLIGTPLTAFSRVVAADDHPCVFDGMCGAESGAVPVSCVSPAVLVDQIEVQKKEKSQDRPPLLPPPPAGAGQP